MGTRHRQLTEPLKLTTHGYNTPYDALRDKTQSILTQIVAHLDYSAMVKQRSLGPDNMEDGTDPSSAFLDALRTRAMDDMHEAALEYGIVLKDLGRLSSTFTNPCIDCSNLIGDLIQLSSTGNSKVK